MTKLIIVDDERMIREGLSTTMPWTEMGIEIVGVAEDGEVALELVRRLRPDIALVDVRMPKTDGLQFLERARAELPSLQVLMLSGYQDFAYVREALRLGAVDYILKPATAEALGEAIGRVRAHMTEGGADSGSSLLRALAASQPEGSMRGLAESIAKWRLSLRHGDATSALDRLRVLFADQQVKALDANAFRELSLGMLDGLVEDFRLAGMGGEGQETEEPFPPPPPQGAGLEALREWLRSLTKKAAAFAEANPGNPSVKRAVEWIDAHFREDVSADMVASVVGLSPNYFSTLFKRARGEGFSDYLSRLRIEEAKRLLAQGGLRVYEVAEQVGYADYRHFGEVFKRFVGVPPARYRPAAQSREIGETKARRLLNRGDE